MPIKLSKPKAAAANLYSPFAARSSPLSPPEHLLTIKQVMAFAKVSEATVRRWIRSKQLRSYRAGRQLRIDKSDLLELLCRSDQI